MKFAVIAPVAAGVTGDPEWMSAFARHVEACGFESIVAVEHTVLMTEYSSVYPYDASGRVELPADCPVPDPLDLLAFLASQTDGLGLATGVLVLPNHHPVVLAKRVATLDALSGGRIRLCVGMGWLKEEIEACGAAFSSRGRRADEQLEVMRLLWEDRPDGASFSGEFFEFDHAACYPKPTRWVPIHIGGHSRAAARRAGRLGDGFQPLGLVGSELADLVAQCVTRRGNVGRDPDALELSLGHLVAKVDGGARTSWRRWAPTESCWRCRPRPTSTRCVTCCRRARKTGTDPMSLNAFDRLALTDLVHLYASAVDDRRFGDVVELFTETAELRLPDPPRSLEPVRRHHGRDGVREAMSAVAAVTRTEHAIVGEVYAPGDDADYALGRITCIAHHWSVTDGQISDVVWHLRYDDEYLRTRAGWRIHGRALTINAIETRPVRRVRGQP